MTLNQYIKAALRQQQKQKSIFENCFLCLQNHSLNQGETQIRDSKRLNNQLHEATQEKQK